RVLWHQFAAEGFGEQGLFEIGQQGGGAGVFGGELVEPGEGGLNAADDFGLLVARWNGNAEFGEPVLSNVMDVHTLRLPSESSRACAIQEIPVQKFRATRGRMDTDKRILKTAISYLPTPYRRLANLFRATR